MSTCHMPLGPDDLHHFIHVLLAGLLLRGLYHDPEDRLRTGLPHQDAAGVAQLFAYLLDFCLDIRVRLGNGLTSSGASESGGPADHESV